MKSAWKENSQCYWTNPERRERQQAIILITFILKNVGPLPLNQVTKYLWKIDICYFTEIPATHPHIAHPCQEAATCVKRLALYLSCLFGT